MDTATLAQSEIISALFSADASPDIPPADRLYDFLIGSWTLQATDYLPNNELRRTAGECHAAWVLEGRAVQDVWICPGRDARHPGLARSGNRYGTTLRMYDPVERVWRVTWINPVTGARNQLVGHRDGDRVVQVGRDDAQHLIRWSFVDITPTSARWLGERSSDHGATWTLQTEFRLDRQ